MRYTQVLQCCSEGSYYVDTLVVCYCWSPTISLSKFIPFHHLFSFTTAQEGCNCRAAKVPNKSGGKPYYHTGNLANHLKLKHLEKFKLQQSKRAKHVTLASGGTQSVMDSFMVISASAIPKKTLVEIELSEVEIERAAAEAVTINGLPLSVFEKSGICKLLSPMLNKLGMTLNRENIRERIIRQAFELRQKISSEVKNKIISLKFDIASQKERGFLGINVQYIYEGSLQLRTLAVKEMFERHTGTEIKECIFDVLELYGIEIIQIYSTTTDNASNMMKCGRLNVY